MSSQTLSRWSGGILLVGGLLSLASSTLSAFLFPGSNATPQQMLGTPWFLSELVLFVGVLLLVMGFPVSYGRQAARAGVLGFIGFVVLWVGMLLAMGFSMVRITVFPVLAQVAPSVLANGDLPIAAGLLLIFGPALLLIVGSILTGIATIRARVFSRWAGFLLLIAGAIYLIALVVPPVGDIIDPLSDAALFLALAWFGYALIAPGKAAVADPSPASSVAQPIR
ncbi:hypothetical protein KSC_110870 [Ktedonobacter sp. SOSP1-52]|uniref:hypothetical protein n=1 Tax=Ktedonobacter sp. SOSP1-52 TaxID=2778366 RepID=UPI0019154D2C|nr:hypothetical protein [Ktedonobacter sp. SOSP1-52]GHO72195.1 hypothetical protein KSC_110870 [Ktedonobacter sp. SOSP1-52]